MTEEQIKQKAEAEADKVIIGSGMDRASVVHLKHLLTTFYIQGYHTGAEPREKRIAELEAQIEKMKCCPNCDFIFRDGNCYYDKECKNKDHWKLRR